MILLSQCVAFCFLQRYSWSARSTKASTDTGDVYWTQQWWLCNSLLFITQDKTQDKLRAFLFIYNMLVVAEGFDWLYFLQLQNLSVHLYLVVN